MTFYSAFISYLERESESYLYATKCIASSFVQVCHLYTNVCILQFSSAFFLSPDSAKVHFNLAYVYLYV